MDVDTLYPLFRTEFPELSEQTEADVRRCLKIALYIDQVRQTNTLWAAAHLVTVPSDRAGEWSQMSNEHDVTKHITQSKTGSLNGAFDTAFWTRTEYGRMYLLMRNRSPQSGMSFRVF